VGDIEDGKVHFVSDPEKVGEDSGPKREVESGQGFVEEENARAGSECPGKRDSAALSSREFVDPSVQKRPEFENLYGPSQVRIGSLPRPVKPEAQIPRYIEVGEERGGLGDPTQAPVLDSESCISLGIGEPAAVQSDSGAGGRVQSEQALEQRTFARTAGPEKHEHTVAPFEFHRKGEIGSLEVDVDQ
jgi:hypothetical protein